MAPEECRPVPSRYPEPSHPASFLSPIELTERSRVVRTTTETLLRLTSKLSNHAMERPITNSVDC